MNSKKLSILLAAVVLIAAQIACAVGEPTLSNIRTAKDQDGTQLTSAFAPSDTIYVVGDLANGQVGNKVTSRWYIESAEGFDPNFFIEESTIDITETGINSVYFFYPAPTDGFPVGTYKVEMYFNNVLVDTVRFTVQ